MTWDLATAKKWLEIESTDTSQDLEILSTMSTALMMAENFIGKGILEQQRTEYLSSSDTANRFYLKTTPLKSVDAIADQDGKAITEFSVRKGIGMLILKQPLQPDSEIEVTYTAGYNTMPDGIEHALWGIFDVLKHETGAGELDDLSSITLPDVGTISYNTQSKPATVKAAFGYYLTLLEPFRVNHGY